MLAVEAADRASAVLAMVTEQLNRLRDAAAEAAATSRMAAEQQARGYDEMRDHALEAAAATRVANAEMGNTAGPRTFASALRDITGAFGGMHAGSRDASTGLKDSERAAGDTERGMRGMGSAVEGAGHVLTGLGVAGGAGESGLKGVVSAADGAVTSFGGFMSAGRMAASALAIMQLAAVGLIPILIGIGVVLSPLIAALASFAVGLAGALAVMTLGIGVLAILGGGMIMLAAKTGELQGPLNQLKATWQGVADTLGRQAVPAATQILHWLNQFAPAIQSMGSQAIAWFNQRLPASLTFFGGIINQLLGFIRLLGSEFGRVADYMLAHGQQFQALWGEVLHVAGAAIDGLITNLLKLSSWFFQYLPELAPITKATFGAIGSVLQFLLQIIGFVGVTFGILFNNLAAGRSPVESLTHTLNAMGVPMNLAIGITNTLATAINVIRGIIEGAVGVVRAFGEAFVKSFASSYNPGALISALHSLGDALQNIFHALQSVAPAFGALAGTIESANFLDFFLGMAAAAGNLAAILITQLAPVFNTLAGLVQRFYPVLQALGVAFLAFKVAGMLEGLVQVGVTIAGLISSFAAATVEEGLYTAATRTMGIETLGATAKTAAHGVAVAATGIAHGVAAAAVWVFNAAKTAYTAITSGALFATIAHTAAVVAHGIAVTAAAVGIGIATVAQWAWNVAMAANPIGLIIIGIAALIAIIVLLVTHWQLVTTWVLNAWRAIQQFMTTHQALAAVIMVLVGVLTGGLVPVIILIATHWQQIVQVAENVWHWITQLVTAHQQLAMAALLLLGPIGLLIAAIILAVQHWQQIWTTMQQVASWMSGVFVSTWQTLQNIVMTAVNFIWNTLQAFWAREIAGWQQIFSWVMNAAQTFWNWAQTLWQAATNFIWNILQAYFNLERAGWQAAMTFIMNAAQAFWQFIQNLWNAATTFLHNLIQTHWAQVMNLYQTAHNWVMNATQVLHSFLQNLWNVFTSWLLNLVNQHWQQVENLFNQAHNAIQSATQGFFNNMVSLWNQIKDSLGRIGHDVAYNIAYWLAVGLDKGIDAVNGFITAVDGLLGTLHLPGIPNIANVPYPSFATGGVMPVGGGFKTEGPTFIRALVGEGAAPEYVIPTETKYRSNALSLWQSAGQELGVLEGGQPDITKIPHAAGGEISNIGAVLAYQAGGIPTSGTGGQCLAFVCQTSGIGCGYPAAADAAVLCNSNSIKAGDVFITTEPPFGHAGYVLDANTALDSNFHLDEKISEHPMSDIYGLGSICFIDPGSPFGGAHPVGGAGGGNPLCALAEKGFGAAKATFESALNGIGGNAWFGGEVWRKGLGGMIEQGMLSLIHCGGGPGPTGGGDCSSIPALMQQFGWNPVGGVAAAQCIAQHESSCNTNAVGGGANGIFQIQVSAHPEFDANKLFDATYNTWAAMQVYNSAGGWGPWTTHSLCGVEAGGLIPKFCEGGVFGLGCNCASGGGMIPYHVADSGNLTLQPGLNMVLNGTGALESLGAGGGGTYIHVEVTEPHIFSEMDAERLSDVIGRRLARQMLPGAGHFIGT